MFCPKCGSAVGDDKLFCPHCGQKLTDSIEDAAKKVSVAADNTFNQAEAQMGSAIRDVKNTLDGNDNYNGGHLKTDRGLLSLILLSIITCGIYYYYFVYEMARDVNIACAGDGKETGGLVKFLVLSFITCGIYAWVWEYKLGNRLASNAPRYGMVFQENGTTVIMWCIFGVLICGIGPYIALNILIKNTNNICAAYNKAHGV